MSKFNSIIGSGAWVGEINELTKDPQFDSYPGKFAETWHVVGRILRLKAYISEYRQDTRQIEDRINGTSYDVTELERLVLLADELKWHANKLLDLEAQLATALGRLDVLLGRA